MFVRVAGSVHFYRCQLMTVLLLSMIFCQQVSMVLEVIDLP